MWAFVGPDYKNAPENPAISLVVAPATSGTFLI
jgi:hypothetical protein